MQVPLELTLKDVPDSAEIEEIIHGRIEKLEKVYDNIISCRVAVEKIIKDQQSGNPFRVRLNLRVPKNHEIVIKREPGGNNEFNNLGAMVRDAFDTAQRQLKELSEKKRT